MIYLKCQVSSGIPQGSFLGPMLFSLYVNDMHSVVREMCTIVQYADDTQFMLSGPHEDISDITSRLQVALLRLAEWLARNRLALIVAKTQVIVLGSKAR